MDDEALQLVSSEALGCISQLKDDLLADPSALSFAPGISLLSLKSHVLLSYLHNLALLCAQRLQGASFAPDDSEDGKEAKRTVEELVWDRLVMERIRPMQGKLRYQIDKLVKKAEDAEARGGQLDEDEVINDPLSFRPNPAAMLGNYAAPMPSTSRASYNPEEDDDEAVPSTSRADGIYRPPRIAAVPYPSNDSQKKTRAAPAPLAVRDSVALPRALPHSESTSGLGLSSLSTSARAANLARIKSFEEDNMMRVFGTKKELKRRRMDEEDVALGGQGVTSRDPKGRRRGGLESEFADLLGGNDTARKGKLRRNKDGDLDDGKKAGKDPYAALREQGRIKKARFDDRAGGSTELGSGGKRKKGAFEKAVHRNQKSTSR